MTDTKNSYILKDLEVILLDQLSSSNQEEQDLIKKEFTKTLEEVEKAETARERYLTKLNESKIALDRQLASFHNYLSQLP